MTLKEIKLSLKKVLANFGQVETDKGVLEFVGEDLVVGSEVYINSDVAADGEYVTPDNKTIIVESGLIKEIKEPVTEEPKAEEELEEATPDFQAEIDEIKAQLADLVNIVAELTSKLQEIESKLAEPVAEPAEEEFKKNVKPSLFRN